MIFGVSWKLKFIIKPDPFRLGKEQQCPIIRRPIGTIYCRYQVSKPGRKSLVAAWINLSRPKSKVSNLSSTTTIIFHMNSYSLNLNSVALVRERTIPTERPPPVGEVSANYSLLHIIMRAFCQAATLVSLLRRWLLFCRPKPNNVTDEFVAFSQ